MDGTRGTLQRYALYAVDVSLGRVQSTPPQETWEPRSTLTYFISVGGARIHSRHALAQPGRVLHDARRGARVPAAQVGQGARVPSDQRALPGGCEPHRGAVRV